MYSASLPRGRYLEGNDGAGILTAMNGDTITYQHIYEYDEYLMQVIFPKARAEVHGLRRTHGIRYSWRDAASIYFEEGASITFLYESKTSEQVLFLIPCIRGGLGNALTYALVTGECDSVGGKWGLVAVGRDGHEGDVLISADLTPSEKQDVLDRCTLTADRASMGLREIPSDYPVYLQKTHRRPRNNTIRPTSEDAGEDDEEEEEGNNSLGGRGGRAPPPGTRNSTRQGGNRGGDRRDRQPDARGQRRDVRDRSPEPRLARVEQRQANSRRETKNGRSRGTPSADNRGPNLEYVDNAHPKWRDFLDGGESGGGPPRPSYRSSHANAVGGGRRRAGGSRR